jgi:putative methyltransferase (TIGR04325 family)
MLPPSRALLRRWHEQRFASVRGVGALSGAYSSIEAAKLATPRTHIRGYETPGTGAMYRDMLDGVLPKDYPALFWLRDILPTAERLFDLGGHVGVSFFAYGRYIEYTPALRWLVCDVDEVVRDGAVLARERNATQLLFTTDMDKGEGADVLLASGSLQYIPRPLADIMAGWKRLPRHVLVNQMPTHPDRTFVTLQNIGVAICPYRISAYDALPTALARLGYRLVDTWEDPSRRTSVPHEPNGGPISYTGYYLRLG